MRKSTFFIALVCGVLANMDIVTSELAADIDECDTDPVPGICEHSYDEYPNLWTFNTTTQSCQHISGCYAPGSGNVFFDAVECRDACGRHSECEATPREHPCKKPRTYWTFKMRLGKCVRIVGCYRTNDDNVFLYRDVCRNVCRNVWRNVCRSYCNGS